mmetsp:Transcript_34216/g.39524  ORF Transcript_34216/g.39524 Transcript_34216/m.39524 type:complete len:95 (+) Transcript_34216:37-321(+)|eukprot:CAMPEP_0168333782 /NCGR_PEP_ID=MMETSP0213-20121227/9826_1 /TAXON_ID=151035 /ORGANISM="Euplotes harpa, Strain FSP1.4" /LENGTH=94 /DNA_ID=CAMNT_0008338199 /DNA_START=18 /DNA_END=302 /DNA_ORIENTATION=-
MEEEIKESSELQEEEKTLMNTSTNNDGKKTTKRISKDKIKMLREWLRQNKNYPYPAPGEVAKLVSKTELSEKQIRVWFTNYRYRKFSPDVSCLS